MSARYGTLYEGNGSPMRMQGKQERNSLCKCGSGKKAKKCCGEGGDYFHEKAQSLGSLLKAYKKQRFHYAKQTVVSTKMLEYLDGKISEIEKAIENKKHSDEKTV